MSPLTGVIRTADPQTGLVVISQPKTVVDLAVAFSSVSLLQTALFVGMYFVQAVLKMFPLLIPFFRAVLSLLSAYCRPLNITSLVATCVDSDASWPSSLAHAIVIRLAAPLPLLSPLLRVTLSSTQLCSLLFIEQQSSQMIAAQQPCAVVIHSWNRSHFG
nr:hypothetical protein L203_04275 [Cryptococcus depauperatus CBS 7841]